MAGNDEATGVSGVKRWRVTPSEKVTLFSQNVQCGFTEAIVNGKCISYIYPRACTKLNDEFLKKTSTYCNCRPSTECLCFVLSTERTAFRDCSKMLTPTC